MDQIYSEIKWTAENLAQMIKLELVNLDLAEQRAYVWDNKIKSLLIYTMMKKNPMPIFMADKVGKIYYVFDGKQRSEAILGYISGNYRLSGIPKISYRDFVETEDKTAYEVKTIDVNKLKFNELPETLQKTILSYVITIYCFDNMGTQERKEMIFLLNNGKSFTPYERSRIYAVSINKIKALSEHSLFNTILSKTQLRKGFNEELVGKAWGVLYIENMSFNKLFMDALLATTEITEEQNEELTIIFDRVLNVYKTLKYRKEHGQEKQEKKIITTINKPTHFYSLVVLAKESLDSGISIEKLTDWVEHFYSPQDQSTSISRRYNDIARAGTSKSEIIKERIKIVKDDFYNFQ